MFSVYLIKVVWEFGVETLAFALALIKCCWVAKSKRNSFTKCTPVYPSLQLSLTWPLHGT